MSATRVGVVFIFAGIAIIAYTLSQLAGGAALDRQTKVPGTVTAELNEPGRYYIWDNHWTKFEGERVKYSSDWPNNAKVAVRETEGRELEFIPDRSLSWSIGNNGKTSIGYIEIDTPSSIELDIDDVGNGRIVSVSNRTMKQELWKRLGGFGIGLITAGIGAIVCILGVFKRPRKMPTTGDTRPVSSE